MNPDPRNLRLTRYHALPTTSTAIALLRGEVVGTISVICDGLFGLPGEKLFDLSRFKTGSNRVVEVSSLAVKKEFRSNHGAVLFPLIKFVIQ